jgi:hypothetical protein
LFDTIGIHHCKIYKILAYYINHIGITIKWQHNNSAVVGYIIQKSENEINRKKLIFRPAKNINSFHVPTTMPSSVKIFTGLNYCSVMGLSRLVG